MLRMVLHELASLISTSGYSGVAWVNASVGLEDAANGVAFLHFGRVLEIFAF